MFLIIQNSGLFCALQIVEYAYVACQTNFVKITPNLPNVCFCAYLVEIGEIVVHLQIYVINKLRDVIGCIYIQFSTDMDSLELYLKMDKMDPALVPENSVKHKEEAYQKMNADWTEVDNKGKQLIKDVTDVSQLLNLFEIYLVKDMTHRRKSVVESFC